MEEHSEETIQEVQIPEEQNLEERPAKSRKWWWIMGGILLVVVIAGAAFVAGKLLTGQGLAMGGPEGGMIRLRGGEGGAMTSVEIEIDPEQPEELPKTKADVNGIFVKREDNSITVGTGNGNMMAIASDDGEVEIKNEVKGPEVEVVVTKDTQIYRDATFDDQSGPPAEGQKIKRKVAEGVIEDIGANCFLTVWGRKSGDRVIADVILYSSPFMVKHAE